MQNKNNRQKRSTILSRLLPLLVVGLLILLAVGLGARVKNETVMACVLSRSNPVISAILSMR